MIGLQCINDSGSYQIDGIFKGFILARHVVATTTQNVGGDVPDNSSIVLLPINSGEIVAVRSSTFCVVKGIGGGVANICADAGVGTEIHAYFFAPITTSDANVGLQVYNDQSQLIFCASKKPLSIVGSIVGNTTSSTFAAGRTYATIGINPYVNLAAMTGGVMPNPFFFAHEELGMTRIDNNVVYSDIKATWSYLYYPSAGSTMPTISGFGTTTQPSNFMVIDVTNY